MSIQVLIVDDEPLARERLRRLLSTLDDYSALAEEAADAAQALQLARELTPDIVLLDIQMPGGSGLQVAEQLAQLPVPPALIFCTAYSEYALEAFSVQASAYLLKPVRPEALSEALTKAARSNRLQLQQQAPEPVEALGQITAHSHRGLERVSVADVRCFIADNKYVAMHYLGGELLIDETLKQLEQRYADHFIRVHRNALVACQYIVRLCRQSEGGYLLELEGCELQLPVSRRHLAEVRRLLQAP